MSAAGDGGCGWGLRAIWKERIPPHPLSSPSPHIPPTHTATPPEPILLPKLRIHLADFPYPPCSTTRGCAPWRPAAVVGTARRCPAPLDFHGPSGTRQTRPAGVLFRPPCRLASQAASAACAAVSKKRQLFPGPPPASPGSHALPHGSRGFWNVCQIPFCARACAHTCLSACA